MATRTIQHNGKEHIIRTTKQEVFGLKIDDVSIETNDIPVAFGWDAEVFLKMMQTYSAFIRFQRATQDLDPDLPASTAISEFTDFLMSPSFKKLNIKIDQPNDHLILGFMLGGIKAEIAVREMGGGLKELLEGLKRDLEERE